MDFLKEKISVTLAQLKQYRKLWHQRQEGFLYAECGYKTGHALPDITDPSFTEFKGEVWNIKADTHAWFYKHIVIPEKMVGKAVRLEVSTGNVDRDFYNPQFMVYVDGALVQGLDVNHKSVILGTGAEYDVYIYAYSGAISHDLKFLPSLYVTNELVEKLYYDMKIPFDLLECFNPISKEYADMLEYLDRAANFIDFRQAPNGEFMMSVLKADEYLENEFYAKYCHVQEISAICVGHTHIDCAWRWTLKQTREKVQRSFSNMMRLMDAYPEFTFMQSQPLLYQYTKEEAPLLYEEIKQRVKEGRWEPEGASWVETDCNLPSGESFVRQFLYGKRFFRDEFGVDSKVFWVPDVFGYSAALPQIMRKSGVDYFVTSKISWNEKNRHPYDIFRWRGIDGSEVNSYFLTSQERDVEHMNEYVNRTHYNARLRPRFVVGTYDRLQQKNLSSEVLLPFGYGDGGGGPTEEHMENVRRMSRGIRSCPNAKMGFVKDFLETLFEKNQGNDRVPVWEGELYFELHRGTLTSVARNKRNNRKSEFLYQNVEQLAITVNKLLDREYPQESIRDAWLTILTNQFHDIIPGSSIKEVYEDSDVDYARILKQGTDIQDDLLNTLAGNIDTRGGVMVYNPHSCVKSGNVRINGRLVYVDNLSPKGWCVTTPKEPDGSVNVSDGKIDNEYFTVEFNSNYVITRIFDKKNQREVLKEGGLGNKLVAYEDYPKAYDAWEISEYYVEKHWDIDNVSAVEKVCDGVRSGFKIERKFLSSVLTQYIWFYENSPKIDFETEADWHEDHLLVKTLFDTNVHAARATYNIQFGNLERPTVKNTTWDTARFEVCAHKFADLSEGNYGVTLMNDCKYGYSINDGVMGLSLIKCATDPNPVADEGRHVFTYSLYTHGGRLEDSDVQALAYELNEPLVAISIPEQKGSLPENFSLVSVDKSNIIVETVKKAEDSDAIIMRLYECTNSRTPCTLCFGIPVNVVSICDLGENELETVDVEDNRVRLVVKPYEIVTLKIN